MDLALFMRVVWRYRRIVLVGLIVTILLSAFALLRFDSKGVTLRGGEEWTSRTTLFVTQPGFPWGRLQPEGEAPSGPSTQNATRLSGLSTLYSKLADTDQVIDLMKASLPHDGWRIEAAPVLDGSGLNNPLPLLQIAAVATSAKLAQETAGAAASSLQSYVRTRQENNAIPEGDRVVLQVIKEPEDAKLISGRSFTLPLIIFLLLGTVTLAVPFVIDNLRRSFAAPSHPPADLESDDPRDRRSRGASHRATSGARRDG
jgi:hypothetical protein